MSGAHASRYLLTPCKSLLDSEIERFVLTSLERMRRRLEGLGGCWYALHHCAKYKILTTSMFEGDRRSTEGMRRVPSVVAKGKQEG